MIDIKPGDRVKCGFTYYRLVNSVYKLRGIEFVDGIEIRGTHLEGTAPHRLAVHMLTKIPAVVDVQLPDTHVHTEACEHQLIEHEVAGVRECYSCGPHVRDQYCPNACPVVLTEVLADNEQVTR